MNTSTKDDCLYQNWGGILKKMKPRSLVISLISALILVPFVTIRAAPLSGVQSFGYQLQEIDPAALKASPFDLIVMDYSSDGAIDGEYSRATIEDIAAGKSGRIVLSYLSIGEAEDYRFYFRSGWVKRAARKPCRVALTSKAPEWLDNPNRNFCGNYKTRYWLKAWQRKIFGIRSGTRKSYLDRIIDMGFQGVYLDIIDGYEYWALQRSKSRRRKTAARDMAQFVERVSKYARETRGQSNFTIVPQNGALILSELSTAWRARYLAAIDGIGAEDSFYFGDESENNPLDPQTATLAALAEFRAAGKTVLSIDYLTELGKIDDFTQRACAAGFIPQVSIRELDSLEAQTLSGCL